MKFVAKTFHGLEQVLATELADLGAAEIKPLRRAVSFEASQHVLYAANLWCRTALKILRPVYHFQAFNENQLYRRAMEFDWTSCLKLEQTFSVEHAVHSDYFNHSRFVALKFKDALVDQFRKKFGRRPSVDTANPDIRIDLHLHQKDFTISLNSSGESLHRRGYRDTSHRAPLNEVLAAGMLKLAGWNPEIGLTDPMCGSGTIVIEAGLITNNLAPNLKRSTFGFMQWQDFDAEKWQKIRAEAEQSKRFGEIIIQAGDISQKAIDASRAASIQAGVNRQIAFQRQPFSQHDPIGEAGILMFNPPYGERMKLKDVEAFYRAIGDTLKRHWSGYDAWILSANRDALKNIGLRPSKKYTLFNGALECKFQKFSMYRGSKKTKYQKVE